MKITRQALAIPTGQPRSGATLSVLTPDTGASIGSDTCDADGFATVQFDGTWDDTRLTISQGQDVWREDSRTLMPWASELSTLIDAVVGDGVLEYGEMFRPFRLPLGSFTVTPGAAIFNGMLGVWYSEQQFGTEEGDRALVIYREDSGRLRLNGIDYADLGAEHLPLWRYTITSGQISNLTWIGEQALSGPRGLGGSRMAVVRLASDSTTNASMESSDLTCSLAIPGDGITYDVTVRGSVVSRTREGGVRMRVNWGSGSGNGDTLDNGDDVTTELAVAIATSIAGPDTVTAILQHKSQTALTTWTNLLTAGSFGAGTAPNFNTPGQVAVDSSGNVYIADTSNNRIVKLNSSGAYVGSFGSFGTGDANLKGPTGVAVDNSGNIYVTDPGNGYVKKFDSSFVFVAKQSAGAGTTAANHLTTDGTYLFYTRVSSNQLVRTSAVTMSGQLVFGATGSGDGQFSTAYGIANDGTHFYVVDQGNNRVQKFLLSGVYVSQFPVAASQTAIALLSTGKMLTCGAGSSAVRVYSSAGVLEESFTQSSPNGVGVGPADVVWVSNSASHNVAKWSGVAGSFSWDAGVISMIAVPRS